MTTPLDAKFEPSLVRPGNYVCVGFDFTPPPMYFSNSLWEYENSENTWKYASYMKCEEFLEKGKTRRIRPCSNNPKRAFFELKDLEKLKDVNSNG